jgi:hypothetical protein
MIDRKIMAELYKTVEFLLKHCAYNVDALGILSAIGSYGDTLDDDEVFDCIKDWNETMKTAVKNGDIH